MFPVIVFDEDEKSIIPTLLSFILFWEIVEPVVSTNNIPCPLLVKSIFSTTMFEQPTKPINPTSGYVCGFITRFSSPIK